MQGSKYLKLTAEQASASKNSWLNSRWGHGREWPTEFWWKWELWVVQRVSGLEAKGIYKPIILIDQYTASRYAALYIWTGLGSGACASFRELCSAPCRGINSSEISPMSSTIQKYKEPLKDIFGLPWNSRLSDCYAITAMLLSVVMFFCKYCYYYRWACRPWARNSTTSAPMISLVQIYDMKLFLTSVLASSSVKCK